MGDSWEEQAGGGANGGGGLNPNAVPFQLGKLNADAPAFVPQSALQPPEPMQESPQESEDVDVENGGDQDEGDGEYPLLLLEQWKILFLSSLVD